MYRLNDNIFALSTPIGQAALAVVRISGSDAVFQINSLFSKNISNAKGYSMHYGFISTPQKELIDEVILSVFRAPHSFTGEDMVEVSCHGSPVIVKLLLETFGKIDSFRSAEPGEFSLRAYQNNKMDLIKAESIADLIHAESEAAHKVAINQLKDGISKTLVELRQELVDFAALLELELDFSEEDVEFAKRDALRQLCDKLLTEIEKLVGTFKYGNAIKEGINTAIVGRPNAGKSTLLNCLLEEDRAIVSHIAGTTRDTIKEKFTVNGIQFNLIDTAGIREQTEDQIEAIGIERARKEMLNAELVIYCIDSKTDPLEIENNFETSENTFAFFTKSDQISEEQRRGLENKFDAIPFLSAKNNEIEPLTNLLKVKAEELSSMTSASLVTNQRHLEALQHSQSSLEQAITGIDNQMYIEQIAADLREALHFLGSITGGSIDANEVLGSVFSRFCIGK